MQQWPRLVRVLTGLTEVERVSAKLVGARAAPALLGATCNHFRSNLCESFLCSKLERRRKITYHQKRPKEQSAPTHLRQRSFSKT